jgi:hypothetical protein
MTVEEIENIIKQSATKKKDSINNYLIEILAFNLKYKTCIYNCP